MTKKILSLIIIFLFLTLIPMTSAIQHPIRKTRDDPTILNRTFIRGFISLPRETNNGKTVSFYALRLHFLTISLDGVKTGNIRLQSITIPNKLTGFTSRFYIIGSFHGNIDY